MLKNILHMVTNRVRRLIPQGSMGLWQACGGLLFAHTCRRMHALLGRIRAPGHPAHIATCRAPWRYACKCITTVSGLQALLDDQSIKAASMRASPLIGPLAGAASAWGSHARRAAGPAGRLGSLPGARLLV